MGHRNYQINKEYFYKKTSTIWVIKIIRKSRFFLIKKILKNTIKSLRIFFLDFILKFSIKRVL